MGLTEIDSSIDHLIDYWIGQGIDITPIEIETRPWNGYLTLPSDFRKFYSMVNGMKSYYPNDVDQEGFLFYPVEALAPVEKEFGNSALSQRKIQIFAEYLHKSWWYGFEVTGTDDYAIGIIPDENTFKPIASSLAGFIEMYLSNSDTLYNHE